MNLVACLRVLTKLYTHMRKMKDPQIHISLANFYIVKSDFAAHYPHYPRNAMFSERSYLLRALYPVTQKMMRELDE